MTAHSRRRLHMLFTIVWAGPGALAAYLLKDSIPFVAFMSWYAIVVSHLAGWSAETPVELEES